MNQSCPIHTLLAVVGFAANAGVSPPDLLRAAGLDAADLADPDALVPNARELRLWDEAVRLTGDQDFGLHLAEWASDFAPDHFDVMAFTARSCATLGARFTLTGRYIRLLHEGIYLTLEEEGDVARLVHGHVPERIGPRHPVEGMLALAILHARQGVGDDLVPQAVCFSHARPARVSEHERIFRAPVHYDRPRNELVLDRALLGRPQRHAEPRLLGILEPQLGELLSKRPEVRGFRDRVERCIMDELPQREPVVGAVALKLHMSARSLQRRLQDEGTSFAEVLSDLRRDLAWRYLADPRISISEVAFLLGFLDVSAFYRAFKRWTGDTPSAYRRRHSGA